MLTSATCRPALTLSLFAETLPFPILLGIIGTTGCSAGINKSRALHASIFHPWYPLPSPTLLLPKRLPYLRGPKSPSLTIKTALRPCVFFSRGAQDMCLVWTVLQWCRPVSAL